MMEASIPGWVGPTIAISLVVIALAAVAIGTVTVAANWTARRKLGELGRRLEGIRAEAERVLETIRELTETGADEARHYLATSKSIRRDLELGVERVKSRLADLDALYEVVHEEVEDTALDVAARVRAVRQGASVVGKLRRWMVRGRR